MTAITKIINKSFDIRVFALRTDSSISKGVQRKTIEGMIIYLSDWDP